MKVGKAEGTGRSRCILEVEEVDPVFFFLKNSLPLVNPFTTSNFFFCEKHLYLYATSRIIFHFFIGWSLFHFKWQGYFYCLQ